MIEKPEYRVPTMNEIRELRWNGFNAISTFSGCGGSSLGYRLAGFKVLWASEFVDAAREVYKANKADYTFVDGRDIRAVTPEEILKQIGMKQGELDLLDGSPPCASFSTSGSRQKGWSQVRKYSDKAQRVDDLFFEFTRILEGLQPKTFVAENVSGLVKGVAKGYFKEILQSCKQAGYVVKSKLLDAQWLGVPQARQRIIFVGVRKDLDLAPEFPRPFAYRYSVRDVLPYIQRVRKGGKPNNWGSPDDPSGTICAGDGSTSPTAYLSTGGWIVGKHKETRKWSIPELRKICGFPDDFQITGDYAQQYERMGRAVPPLMMQQVAATIRDEILNKIKRTST